MLALWAVAAWVRLRAVEHAIVGSDSLGPYLQAKAALLGHLPRPPNPESGDALWMLAVPLVAWADSLSTLFTARFVMGGVVAPLAFAAAWHWTEDDVGPARRWAAALTAGLLMAFDPGLVDTLVTPVQPENGTLVKVCETIARARSAGLKVAANTVLTANALPSLGRAARPLAKAAPDSMTFTYPFPINGNEATSAPNPGRVMSALRPALAELDRAGVSAQIKGLPACHLGRDAHRLGRTSNRYYVDADHQTTDALVFFPDVVRFHKDDVCRFCTQNEQCDGFFSTYLRRPGFPPLRPVEEVTPTTGA